MHFFIYITTNTINGKRYIGKHSTNNLDDGYLGSGILLNRAIKNIGKEYFVRDIIFEAYDNISLSEAESRLIEEYGAIHDPMFYNIARGGYGGDTFSGASEEDRNIRAKIASDRLKGKPKSDKHKQAISKAKMGKTRGWVSEESEASYKLKRKELFANGELAMPIGNMGNRDFRHEDETKNILREKMKQRREKARIEGRDYQSREGKLDAKNKLEEYWTDEARAIHAKKMRSAYETRLAQGIVPKIWIHIPETTPTIRRQIPSSEIIPEGWCRGKGKTSPIR